MIFKSNCKLITYLLAIVLTNLVFVSMQMAVAHSLRVVTEDSYPVQYVENGQLKGKNATSINTALEMMEIDASIEVLPWARAYNMALSTPNVLIFSITRTPEREDLFIWGRAMTDLHYALYRHKDNKQTVTDESVHQLDIAVIRHSATEQYLSKHAFDHLHLVNNPVQMINMLNKQRVDAIPANETSLAAYCRKMALDCSNLEPFYRLKAPSTKLYYAFSKGTDPELIARFNKRFDQINRQIPAEVAKQ